MDSVARGEGGGRRVEEGGNRYQTINADHHNIGGSTAVLLVEHRRYGMGTGTSRTNKLTITIDKRNIMLDKINTKHVLLYLSSTNTVCMR